jgi:hypothetical protein
MPDSLFTYIYIYRSPNHVTTDGQSASMSGIELTLGLVTRYYFLSECYCLVSVGRPH